MTLSQTGELPPATPSPAGPAPGPGPRPRGRGLRRVGTIALLALACVPGLFGLVDLWLERAQPYQPHGDHALLALVVDAVGDHEVLLGAYSRFGWYHPGPLHPYLLAVPHHLMGGALQSLSAGMLVTSALSVAAAVWLVRRRAGVVAAVWALLVITLSVQIMGDDFIRDPWNPYLPVLPFLVGVLLCWTAVRGEAWALPPAVVPMSLAGQAHVGYLPAIAAIGAVLAVGLLSRAVRHRRHSSLADGAGTPARRPVRWLVASVLAVALGVLLWLPTIVQQVTGTPGNAGVLYEYLLQSSPEQPAGLPVGLRTVADEVGKLPAHLVGAGVDSDAPLLPERWPLPAIAVGLVLFVAARAVAAGRRRGEVLWLGAFTLTLAAAGVAAVARIDGLGFPYLVQWTVLVGVLAWTTIGLSLLPELGVLVRRALARPRPAQRPETVLAAPLVAVTAAAVLVAGIGVGRAETPSTDVSGQMTRLVGGVVDDLDRRGLGTGTDGPVVRVDFAGSSRTDVLVGTVDPGSGVVLGLHRAGVDVQVSDFWRIPFGKHYTDRADEAGYVVTVAFADGSSPPPEPWQQVLATEGDYEVYGGVPPGE